MRLLVKKLKKLSSRKRGRWSKYKKGKIMKKDEFDKYKFSINTEINYFEDVWDKVTGVDFEERWVGIERGQIVKHYEIKRIRNL